jgi:hypothetical protein
MSVNLAVVRGTCSSDPEIRVLASGSTLAVLQLTVRRDDAPAVSVPVVVWEPSSAVESFGAGDELVALGRIRRRFFQAGAATGSRVELEADLVVPARDRRRVAALLRKATTALEDLVE